MSDDATLEELTQNNAVCVVSRGRDDTIGVQVYDRDRRPRIRTYLPDAVDGRWAGPVLTTAADVLTHLGQSEEPCSVPVKMAQQLFNWQLPFACLPTPTSQLERQGE
jgi:hypothetical protein